MPGSVKVKVISARNLPIMDRSTLLTDAFVEVCIGSTTFKTEVVRRSLSPSWNTDWFCFEVDDQALQEEALLFKVMDHDTYSTHDTIGRVYFDLNPLISRGRARMLNGWFPIYDTMHGIRGEISLIIRVDAFVDASRYHQSSIGVRFFHSTSVPNGYHVELLIGFIQELVMNDDPEHQWIEKIRTSRASNEARQRLFSRLSGELQRKLGLKVLNLGGNAVIGYQLHFDLEGETGVVVRGIGTAVRLRKVVPASSAPESPNLSSRDKGPPSHTGSLIENVALPMVHDKELSRIGNFLPSRIGKPLELAEFPFLTIVQPIPGLIRSFVSIVAAKSVKLLDKNTPAGLQFRDAWWLELRTEVMQHMNSLNCDAVIGYREECAIFEDVCVLSNYGTAVVLNPNCVQLPLLMCRGAMDNNSLTKSTELTARGADNSTDTSWSDDNGLPVNSSSPQLKGMHRQTSKSEQCQTCSSSYHETSSIEKSDTLYTIYGTQLNKTDLLEYNLQLTSDCAVCHLPRQLDSSSHRRSGFESTPSARCNSCKTATVPKVLLSSVDFISELKIIGKPCLLQSRTCRSKKDVKGEGGANDLSETLPFIEYELHYRLLQKLRLRGMNALFGLRYHITIGENFVAAIATGTAVCLVALPPPSPLLPPASHPNAPRGERKVREILWNQVSNYAQMCRQVFELTGVRESTTSSELDSVRRVSTGLPCPIATTDEDQSTDTTHQDPVTNGVSLEVREPELDELVNLSNEPLPPIGLILATTETIPYKLHGTQEYESIVSDYSEVNSIAEICPTEHDWQPLHSFVRLHEQKLLVPDSFFEFTGCVSTAYSDSNRGINRFMSHHHSLFGPADSLHSAKQTYATSTPGNMSSTNMSTRSSASLAYNMVPGRLSSILDDFNRLTWFKSRRWLPCAISAIDFRISITDDDYLQVLTTGMVCVPTFQQKYDLYPTEPVVQTGDANFTNITDPSEQLSTIDISDQFAQNVSLQESSTVTHSHQDSPNSCLLTPLSNLSTTTIEAYLGNLDFFFIRETTNLREEGGLTSFIHTSLSEVQAVVGAHTASLGGNALLSYHLSEVVILRPNSRNQAQCLLNVCGDMVKLSSTKSDKRQAKI